MFFFIKNNEKSIFRDLGMICIFLIRKNHEISTSQRNCRWSVALFLSIFVFLFETWILCFLSLDDYLMFLSIVDDYLMLF